VKTSFAPLRWGKRGMRKKRRRRRRRASSFCPVLLLQLEI
jgi:hypothetical protein